MVVESIFRNCSTTMNYISQEEVASQHLAASRNNLEPTPGLRQAD